MKSRGLVGLSYIYPLYSTSLEGEKTAWSTEDVILPAWAEILESRSHRRLVVLLNGYLKTWLKTLSILSKRKSLTVALDHNLYPHYERDNSTQGGMQVACFARDPSR